MLTLFFVIFVLGVALEVLSLRRDPSQIGIENTLSAALVAPGEHFHVQTVIANKSRLPLSYLAVSEVYPLGTVLPAGMAHQEKGDGLHVKLVCRMKGRERIRRLLELSISRRGAYLFRGTSLDCGDFLGFREISRDISYRREIVVYPERYESQSLVDALGDFCGDVAARRFLIRDPILTVGSRAYTGREPMKEMHWPQSARRGELMVREFDYTRQLSASVILSAEGLRLSDVEEMDECCAAARTICETLVDCGISVDFFTNARLPYRNDRGIWTCTVSVGHTGELLEGLGRAMSAATSSLAKLLSYASYESNADTAFIVVLPADDLRGQEALSILKEHSGREALLIKMSNVKAGAGSVKAGAV